MPIGKIKKVTRYHATDGTLFGLRKHAEVYQKVQNLYVDICNAMNLFPESSNKVLGRICIETSMLKTNFASTSWPAWRHALFGGNGIVPTIGEVSNIAIKNLPKLQTRFDTAFETCKKNRDKLNDN